MPSVSLKAVPKRQLLGAICIVLIHVGCKADIVAPLEAPVNAWGPRLNTHPKGAAFQALIDDYVRRGLPGVVLYVKSPVGVWNGAAGYAKLETREPMTPMHLHHSGSNAKTYTATAVMLLVEEGKIALDAKINTYLPSSISNRIANGNDATVRHLLNHRSGIREFEDEVKYGVDVANDPFAARTPDFLLEYVYDRPALFRAGNAYSYSNTNYLLLALLMDQVLGESHATFMRERIFRRLGLENTYYKMEPGLPRPPGLVNSYGDTYGNGRLVNVSDLQTQKARITAGESGVLATSHDYARFLEALLRGELVTVRSLSEMTKWVRPAYYGFGLQSVSIRHGPAIGHDGANVGTMTQRWYFPDARTLIVLLTNAGDYGRPEKLFNELFWDRVIQAVLE